MAPAQWRYDQWNDEWVCEECHYSKAFYHEEDLKDHLENAHWYCRPCDQTFASKAALNSHWSRSSRHLGRYCELCEDLIPTYEDLHGHNAQVHHPCEGCSTTFRYQRDCHQHGRVEHPWCEVHKRAFRSVQNYQAHMRSAAHVARNHACPFRCGRAFIDRATVVQHLEAGTCSSGVNRSMIDNYLRTHDKSRFITTGSAHKLLEGPAPAIKYIASERSYDFHRAAYVCVLCNGSFGTLRGLNAHLASPRHTYAGANGPNGEKLYKCPNSACGKKFATLSGVVQHAEAGSCGVLRLGGMTTTLDSVLGNMRLLTL
ncbi:hypothetical protein JCM10908_001555 [Rhodotorula pacifica]|uniref:uncharacterized protein n=1 Tax=Rhodotorula pacifica TaxID=1495444 RepID=UPI00316CEA4C